MQNITAKKIVFLTITIPLVLISSFFLLRFLWALLFHGELTISVTEAANIEIYNENTELVAQTDNQEGTKKYRLAKGTYYTQAVASDEKTTRGTSQLEQSGEASLDIDFQSVLSETDALYLSNNRTDAIEQSGSNVYIHENESGFIYHFTPKTTTNSVVENQANTKLVEYNNKVSAVIAGQGEGPNQLATLSGDNLTNVINTQILGAVDIITNPYGSSFFVVDYGQSNVKFYKNVKDNNPATVVSSLDSTVDVAFSQTEAVIYFPESIIHSEESLEKNSLEGTAGLLIHLGSGETSTLDISPTQAKSNKDFISLGDTDGIYVLKDGSLLQIEAEQAALLESYSDRVVYNLVGRIWEYDIQSANSYMLADTDGLVFDASFVGGSKLLLAQNGGGRKVIRLRESNSFSIPDSVIGYQTDEFEINANYLFGNKPTIIVTTYGIINPTQYSAYVQQTKDYRRSAIDYLKAQGLNLNQYNIKYIPEL